MTATNWISILAMLPLAGVAAMHDAPMQGGGQRSVAAVERMPRLPEPLAVRDWHRVSREYYVFVLNPATRVDGRRLVRVTPGEAGFRMPSYVARDPADEALTCLSAVIGVGLAGLNPRAHHGIDWVQAAKAWYDPALGMYRHGTRRRGPVVSAGVYGYWPAIMGMLLAAQHPDDPELQAHLRATVTAFRTIAHGMGCPAQPDFDAPGFNFNTGRADGRNEPMNRLGHAPTVAWALLVGAHLGLDSAADLVACARAALQWQLAHPGRYELTHVMGPLAAARLNAEHGGTLDLSAFLDTWFGAGARAGHPWWVTAGTRFGGMTCDGLDAAKWNEKTGSFHAFAMGTLQGPAWLVPVVRYDQRFARAIARYGLHAANVTRLFQGCGLDWAHQDHKDWKDRWDPKNLFFYEAVTPWEWSETRTFRPYATGDPIRLGWGCPRVDRRDYLAQKATRFSASCDNLSLYSGNHVGFLGGICARTDVPGVLCWDCIKTDWFHAAAYPTRLLYNPHAEAKHVTLALKQPADLYDLVAGRFVARQARPGHRLTLAGDQVAVLVATPVDGRIDYAAKRLLVNGVTVDYRARAGR